MADNERIPEEPDVPPEEEEEDIESPFETETIRYMGGDGPVLEVTLDGPKVGTQSIDVFTLGGFLAQVDRVVRGLTAAVRNVDIPWRGRIPRPVDAAPWRTSALLFGSSATLQFQLGEGEATRIGERNAITSPTIEAIAELARILDLDPASTVRELFEFNDRIGNDYAGLVELLAENEIRSTWRPLTARPRAIDPRTARVLYESLRAETEPVESIVTVDGLLYNLDAKEHLFRLEPFDGPIVRGRYPQELADELRGAWDRHVTAEVGRVEHRYAYADRPHETEHTLQRIIQRFDV